MTQTARRLTAVLVGIAAALGAGRPAGAEEGRIQIPFDDVVPVTITRGGSYILTRNLEMTAPGVAILITAPGAVLLDLNGMTVSNTDTAPGTDLIRAEAGLGQDTIRNGLVTGGWAGIGSDGRKTLVVTDVAISRHFSFGIYVGGSSELLEVSRCKFEGVSGVYGITSGGGLSRAHIDGNEFSKYNKAVALSGLSSGSFISNNTVAECVFVGIEVANTEGVVISNNKVSSVETYGILLFGTNYGARVEGNVILGAGGEAVAIHGSGNLISNNLIRGWRPALPL